VIWERGRPHPLFALMKSADEGVRDLSLSGQEKQLAAAGL